MRHLQKAQGDDPPLSDSGAAQAQALASVLGGGGITAVFATPTKRAMETATPLAERLGLTVTPYDPNAPQRAGRCGSGDPRGGPDRRAQQHRSRPGDAVRRRAGAGDRRRGLWDDLHRRSRQLIMFARCSCGPRSDRREALPQRAPRFKGARMADITDTPPDRLSLDPRSEHFDETLLSRGVGIRFNGQEKTNVIEYSVSEGWIRVAAGKSRDRFGQPMTLKLKGKVEPYFERPADRRRGSATMQAVGRFRRIGAASASAGCPRHFGGAPAQPIAQRRPASERCGEPGRPRRSRGWRPSRPCCDRRSSRRAMHLRASQTSRELLFVSPVSTRRRW